MNTGISVIEVGTLLLSLLAILISLFKAPAEKKKLVKEGEASDADAELSQASAIEKYEQTVSRMADRQTNLEKQNDALKDQIRCDRDAFNSRIDLLEQESQQVQAENARLRMEVDALKTEIETYKIANKSLLHENGELKEWAERLVNQIKGLGAEPTPFIQKARSNE
jgi:chromosome segregation ATPase